MACGPFFLMPGAVRVHPHRGRVQRDGLDLDAHDLLQLQLLEDPVHHAAFRPAVHPRVNGMPVAEPLRQTAPLAAMLSYVEQGIQQLKVRQAHVATLHRKTVLDPCVLLLCDLHRLTI
jgi:hypothetical protein